MRCPICGGLAHKWEEKACWVCNCSGARLEFYWSIPTGAAQYDRFFERLRQRYIERGFGWSWFDPRKAPIFVRGED